MQADILWSGTLSCAKTRPSQLPCLPVGGRRTVQHVRLWPAEMSAMRKAHAHDAWTLSKSSLIAGPGNPPCVSVDQELVID